MVARGASIWMPTLDQIMAWGADRPNNVLVYGEWWRIVTAMFVHVGILHLATNMWCLWNLGLLAEPLMGSAGLLAVYILTGAAGNLLSTFYNWVFPARDPSGAVFFQAGAGASGAVFGIAAALIVLLKSKRLPVPLFELKRLRKSVIYFAAINLIIGFSVNFGSGFTGVEIDNSAHMGGFLCGLAFAAPMVPRIGSLRTDFQIPPEAGYCRHRVCAGPIRFLRGPPAAAGKLTSPHCRPGCENTCVRRSLTPCQGGEPWNAVIS